MAVAPEDQEAAAEGTVPKAGAVRGSAASGAGVAPTATLCAPAAITSSVERRVAPGSTKLRRKATATLSTFEPIQRAPELTVEVNSCTRAPSVDRKATAPRITAPRTAPLVEEAATLFPIVTPFKADAWREELEKAGALEEFEDIPRGIRDGFSIGLDDVYLDRTFIPPNHAREPEHLAFIEKKYGEEMALGRLSKGFSPEELESRIGEQFVTWGTSVDAFAGYFRTAPMNVVEQRPGKMRITTDHSFPRNDLPDEVIENLEYNKQNPEQRRKIKLNPEQNSINAIIDTDDFQCEWGTFSECLLKVAEAPEGTQVAVFDVESAFRNVPVHPSARIFTVVLIGMLVFLNATLDFGASPSPGIFGRIADAMVRIFLFYGIEAVLKWVDDFIFFRYDSR